MANLSKAPPLQIVIDTSQLSTLQDKLAVYPIAMQQAMMNAINQTLHKGVSLIAKTISGSGKNKGAYNIKQADIKPHVKKQKATLRQQFLSGRLIVDPSRRPGLTKFGAKNKTKTIKRGKKGKKESVKKVIGVTYTASKARGKQFIPGAFAWPKEGKPKWVAIPYARARYKGAAHPKADTKSRTDRLMFLQGPSVWGMLASANNQAAISADMLDFFQKELLSQVDFQIKARTGQIPNRRINAQGLVIRGLTKPT